MKKTISKNSKTILSIQGLSAGYQDQKVLRDVSFQLHRGEWLGILGPNGAGKTTLLKCLCRVLEPTAGRIVYLGKDLRGWPARDLAKHIAVLTAEDNVRFPFSVREVVMMGRSPYLSRFGWERQEDQAVVDRCLALTDTLAFQHKTFFDLSSGEKRRVMIAQALAQQPSLLLLDEPNAFLDLKHQVALFTLLRRLHRERGLTLLMTMHDLNLAAEFCTRLILMKNGTVFMSGRPTQIVTPKNLELVYGVEAKVCQNPVSGTPWILPLGVSGAPGAAKARRKRSA